MSAAALGAGLGLADGMELGALAAAYVLVTAVAGPVTIAQWPTKHFGPFIAL